MKFEINNIATLIEIHTFVYLLNSIDSSIQRNDHRNFSYATWYCEIEVFWHPGGLSYTVWQY